MEVGSGGAATAPGDGFDVLILGGMVYDGTGRPAQRLDVGVRAGRIAALGELGAARAATVLDASGLVVCPGFIDIHTHSDFALLVDPRGESKLRQGVTTEVTGNCSFTPYPVQPDDVAALQATMAGLGAADVSWDWTDLEGYRRRFDAQGAAINVAPLVGHAALRVAAMGYASRAPTAAELRVMERLTAEAMNQGAFGLSAGLTLVPSAYASTAEVAALCRVVAARGGYYAAHMRMQADDQLAARRETLDIGRRSGVAIEMAHNNVLGEPFWPIVPEMLELLDRERAAGVDVSFDVYPYTAGMSILDEVLPDWAQEGGVSALRARLADAATRRRIRDDLAPGAFGALPWDWETIRVTHVAQRPPGEAAGGGDAVDEAELVGRTIGQIAASWGVDGMEALFRLIERFRASGTFHWQGEANTRLLLQHPLGMVGSDGRAVTVGSASLRGKPHPRFFGTFPRVLGHYVRELGLLTLEQAIYKMTAQPARRVGLRDRGMLAPGNVADVVLFDPATIIDHATFEAPAQYATGVDTVIVAGTPVLLRGALTGARPGRALGRAA